MNAYFFNVTKEEKENILDKHKEIYDGYVTQYAKPEEQPLYVQDFANDKKGITVNANGDVTEYKNVGINEMKHDGKSTGLFADEEPIDEQLDMIGDGPDDLEHGTVEDEDLEESILKIARKVTHITTWKTVGSSMILMKIMKMRIKYLLLKVLTNR